MRRPLCLAAIAFVVAVLIRVQVFPIREGAPPSCDGAEIILTGVIRDLQVKYNAEGNETLQVTLENLQLNSQDADEPYQIRSPHEKALCTIDAEKGDLLSPGDTVVLRGKMRAFSAATNDGGFNSRLYYSILNISFRVTEVQILDTTRSQNKLRSYLYLVRYECGEILDACFVEREVGIMRAILLGESGQIGEEEKNLFQNNGIIHVIAISGLHISALGFGVFTLLRRFHCPRWPAAVFAVLFILLYGMMTGLRASALRAIIMFTLRMFAPLIGRTYDMLSAVSFACILLLVEQPLLLLHSGFQFSFCAVVAVCVLLPKLPKFLKPFAVPITTLPIQLMSYYTFSPYSFLINLLVIPLMSVVLISGVITTVLGIMITHASVFLPLPAWLFSIVSISSYPASITLHIYLWICEIADMLPGNQLVVGSPPVWMSILYVVILAVLAWIGDKSEHLSKSVRRKWDIAQTTLLAIGVLGLLFARTHYPLEVYFLDVGQGDCEVIRIGEATILIDGGSSSQKQVGEYVIGPFLYCHGISEIDIAVVTHEDTDHCSGLLELLKAEEDVGTGKKLPRVRSVVLPSIEEESKGVTYLQIEELCLSAEIPIHYLKRGDKIAVGKAKMNCLHPDKDADYEESNAESIVLLLSYGKFSCLFTGDLEEEGEEDFLTYIRDTEVDRALISQLDHLAVLKVAHHGSRYATSEDFLRTVNAACAVISCGANNRYGHPSEETVERLQEKNMKIYDTRYEGQISVCTDGDRMRIN